MAQLDVKQKLAILADAAKYDASCASSGSKQRFAQTKEGIGSLAGSGICHSYTPDGRCISLLKVLLTNFCMYDCLYCVNRVSSDVRRARFTPREVVDLTLRFYKANMIEGLFLSSGIIQTPDYTMEQVIEVARTLRNEGFRGYVHLKTIPDADPRLIEEAGLHADRLSINVELPRRDSLAKLAPQKDATSIRRAMGGLRVRLDEAREDAAKSGTAPVFAPAGQSTQMIVGADGETDEDVVRSATSLYGGYKLKRVYYSAFSPIPGAPRSLPSKRPPLLREHRLYQADWLYRRYGFAEDEIIGAMVDGNLPLDLDPKLAWALRNRERYPVDLNAATREELLRIPGLGVTSVDRILRIRGLATIDLATLGRISRSTKTLRRFVTTSDWHPGKGLDADDLAALVRPREEQLTLL